MKMKLAVVAITLAILLVTVGGALAQNDGGTSVVIHNSTFNTNAPIYWNFDNNGVNDDYEFVGMFDTYLIYDPFDVTWTPYNFGSGVNGSYKVGLYQEFPDGNLYVGRLAHHWAENPNGTRFTFGSLGWGEPVCLNCPSFFGVTPETYTKYYDPATDTYEYEYTDVAGAPSQTTHWIVFEAP
jgi:hypothetical protein